MKPHLLLTLLLITFWTGGCAGPATTLKVGGDDANISGFLIPVKETFEEETKTSLSIMQIEPGEELVQLVEGNVDAIIATSSLKELLQEAALKRLTLPPASLHMVEVGSNRTVIFLHKNNRIKQLNQKQLKSIFTGKIRNWRQFGGPDQEIIIVWDSTSAAENEAFLKKILKESPMAAKFRSADSYEEVRKSVMETPGAIGIAPSGFIAPGVKVPKTPKVSSPVILVTKGKPSPLTNKLIDILKDAAYIQ
ncbi:ABC transporter, periplasmic substrate-binding lipoprotein [Geotalea daltonii FRC-32]|uniref:ABC transporter, periplasmic substrate-binding lipoprotein n=1 Tax=Geotalea daltonii (strain DSM 22248 / JCM 15807 / FRC-32) TaxID=316067 RepID=B9M5F1_GEODF|nr:substrate-binding domain-containing protein [Geotalea daltonii]ACM19906.1 ABC transporter, periplasmic substrate-binding lipoprotein [Geotalea daltonii FRC-32]